MSEIEALCRQIISEAQAVMDYTKDIEGLLHDPKYIHTVNMLDEIRIDEVEHIQKLALALTECFFEVEEEPSEETGKQESEGENE